jgi:hypothetical protein
MQAAIGSGVYSFKILENYVFRQKWGVRRLKMGKTHQKLTPAQAPFSNCDNPLTGLPLSSPPPYLVDSLNFTIDRANIGLNSRKVVTANLRAAIFDSNLCDENTWVSFSPSISQITFSPRLKMRDTLSLILQGAFDG